MLLCSALCPLAAAAALKDKYRLAVARTEQQSSNEKYGGRWFWRLCLACRVLPAGRPHRSAVLGAGVVLCAIGLYLGFSWRRPMRSKARSTASSSFTCRQPGWRCGDLSRDGILVAAQAGARHPAVVHDEPPRWPHRRHHGGDFAWTGALGRPTWGTYCVGTRGSPQR